MKVQRFSLGLLLLCLCLPTVAQYQRPNVLLIVADDMGYADIGVFGSDIHTPTIDALADRGITFTRFHTATSCAPSRAMLLSGNNNHVAGIARQGIHNGRNTIGLTGYEGHLSNRVAHLPELMRAGGYRTYMAGKWHLGYEAEYPPTKYGFEKAFNMSGGAANHFDETGIDEERSDYYEHGKPVDYPEGKYSTEVYTDKLIQYLDEHGSSTQPFFMYAAYTSPHWPLQVPEDELDLYAGQFDSGYDVYRKQRFDALKSAGAIPKTHKLPPGNPSVTPWSNLTKTQRRTESRKMELYAAMVDNLDRNLSRLLEHLKKLNVYDNTLIIFMSDNGADAKDNYKTGPLSEYLKQHYNIDYDNMGKKGSFISYGKGWAEAGSAPFRRYKTIATEGGIVAPMIISGPGVLHKDLFDHSYVQISDIAPTLYELAGITYPEDKIPMTGKSLNPFLKGDYNPVHHRESAIAYYHAGQAYLRHGDWKLVNVDSPFDEENFALYDLTIDLGETNDLKGKYPDKYDQMINLWREERRRMGIILPEDL